MKGEIMVLSLASLVGSPLELVTLAAMAAAGQMTGKAMTYWAVRGGLTLGADAHSEKLERWRGRFQRTPKRSFALVFVSAVAGVPPFYLITLLAGALKLPFAPFAALGACGRLLHFGAVVFAPGLLRGVMG
jgi:membrane protein YqaA with SNARE-associated domain